MNEPTQRNLVAEIGNLIAQKGNPSLGNIWEIKSAGYGSLSISEQIRNIIQQYRPVILNISDASQAAQSVMHEAYYSEDWIRNFKQHVVPIIIKYGIA